MLEGIVRGRCELDALEAQWLFMVGEYTRSGAWPADGFLSAAAAIQIGFTRARSSRIVTSVMARPSQASQDAPKRSAT